MMFLMVEGDPVHSENLTLPVETLGGAAFLCDTEHFSGVNVLARSFEFWVGLCKCSDK